MGYTLQFSNIPAWLFYRPTILMKSLWRHDGGGNSSVVLYSKTSRIFAKHFCAEFRQIPFLQEISVTKFLTPLLASHVVPQHLVGFAQVQEKISQRSIRCVCVQVQEKISTIESSIP